MRFLENISHKYYSKVSDLVSIEEAGKLFQLHFFAWLAIVFYFIFAAISYISNLHVQALILAGGGILSLIIILLSSKAKKRNTSAMLILIIASLVLFLMILFEKSTSYKFLWTLALPIIISSYFGHRRGLFLSMLFFILILGLFFVFREMPQSGNNNFIFLIEFGGVYLLISFVSYFFEVDRWFYSLRQEKLIYETKNENKKKDDFLSMLSHQIRTPLNNLTMVSNLIDREKLDAEQQDLIDTIIASTNNLINVVNNIVKVSKAEIEEELVSKISFDLFSTIDNTLKLFRNQFKEKLNIDLFVTNDLKYNLIGDPIRLKQIFLNLLENIIKISKAPTINIGIDVTILKQTDHTIQLVFSIKCSSLNLIRFDKENYFIKYSDQSQGEAEDTYLDLGIANKIIELYNGKLEFSSNEKFSTFLFTLEFIPDIKKPSEVAVKPEKESQVSAILEPKKKISLEDANVLLVEDNAINQKIVILSLKKFVKNIDVAFNGKEALDKFGTSKYDLILMDIQMPVMNGIIATKKIRELEVATNSHIPIIAITANALSGDKEACLSAGMNDYISKPFQVNMLVTKMKNLVE